MLPETNKKINDIEIKIILHEINKNKSQNLFCQWSHLSHETACRWPSTSLANAIQKAVIIANLCL